MTNDNTKMSEPMSKEEMIDALKGLVFGTFDRTTAKEREALDMAIKALEQQPCEDCISREALRQKLQEHRDFFVNAFGDFKNMNCIDKARVDEIDNCIAMVVNAPSVTPSHEDLKEAYINGYDYGVKDWFKAKTDKPDIKAEIIKRIEQVRDNDKNAGEYPYNRCIEIIKEVMG